MKSKLIILMLSLATAFCAVPANAVKIADIVRLDGEQTNIVKGWGLVVGLKGTGDGGEFGPAIKPLRELLAHFGDPNTVRELSEVKNVALVMIEVTVPASGVHRGDHLDAHISSPGSASSLKGGRLFTCPLLFDPKLGGLQATCSGPVTIEDPSVPTTGLVKGGATMEFDYTPKVINEGQIKLVVEPHAAAWSTTTNIANMINDAEGSGTTLALATDQRNVIVTIPRFERPADFINRIMQLQLVWMPPTKAKVVINARTGTIVMTGDVEISPVVISHKGLTITTVSPAPVPSVRNPVVTERRALALDTTNRGGAKLRELLDALDAIKVPAEDRIAIIRELDKTGNLHADVVEE
jgi:flagellar P-ring protein precursor FlgI